MATTRKTKNAGALTKTTTVATGEALIKTDASGKLTAIELNQLKAQILGSANLEALYDGVFIMYNSDSGFPFLAKPYDWPALQNNGSVALGVALSLPGRILVVAPTEAPSNGLLFSSGSINSGRSYATDIKGCVADMDGKTNTAAIISASTADAITNTATYAAGFCNLYSRVNSNGKGLTAGKWWLPSAGEAAAIIANRDRINYCLGLITGATKIAVDCWLYTSTEGSADSAWAIYINNFTVDKSTKSLHKKRVRPVSEFIK